MRQTISRLGTTIAMLAGFGCSSAMEAAPELGAPREGPTRSEGFEQCVARLPADTPGELDALALKAFARPDGSAWDPPMTHTKLEGWLDTRYPKVPSGERKTNRLARPLLARTIATRWTSSGTFSAVRVEHGGDCPVLTLRALWFDQRGLLVKDRGVVEGCELVDAAIHETIYVRDDDGRVTEARVSSSPNPFYAFPDRDVALNEQVDVAGPPLPTRLGARCVADYRARTISCGNDMETRTYRCDATNGAGGVPTDDIR